MLHSIGRITVSWRALFKTAAHTVSVYTNSYFHFHLAVHGSVPAKFYLMARGSQKHLWAFIRLETSFVSMSSERGTNKKKNQKGYGLEGITPI